MISGRPPFNGENHIDLLRNIQRKAVRLPANVKVSKECVNLLRILLNRNPLSRAGFAEFFDACNALVALGCQGGDAATTEETSIHRTSLGTIQERPATTADSMLTVATHVHQQQHMQNQQQEQQQPKQQQVQNHPQQQQQKHIQQAQTEQQASPSMGAVTNSGGTAPTPSLSSGLVNYAISSPASALSHRTFRPVLTPLMPSPPGPGASSAVSPPPTDVPQLPFSSSQRPTTTEISTTLRQANTGTGTLQKSSTSTSDNSFVMVGHGSYQLSPEASAGGMPSPIQQPPHSRETSPPTSLYTVPNTSQVLSARGDYMVVKQPKGMLSTSPGTGGALLGMVTGRTRLLYDNSAPGMNWDTHISNITKMVAASEDVGRRAISVAHLGDSRAFIAMKMVVMMNEGSSSLLSGAAMDGIEEEADSGAVTDDSSSTEIMASVRCRPSSSGTDKSMPDIIKDTGADDGDNEEMPFAIGSGSQSPPILSAGMPSRESSSFSKSVSITSQRQTIKPTPALIRTHFGEALSCYLKALKMLKGTVHGAQGVERELQNLSTHRIASEKVSVLQKLVKRCHVTLSWLGNQYKGVLERAEASNSEIGKIPNNTNSDTDRTESSTHSASVEELVYNSALAQGREGAVKQLLGQLEASRSSYRSAGLLAETLLMESKLVGNDRKILEDYVDGFAARITELDELILQRSQLGGAGATATAMSAAGSRRMPGVVSLVGQPFNVPKLSSS